MKALKSFYLIALLAILGNSLYAQTISPWQIHEGNEGVINFVNNFNGDPRAYEKMNIPAKSDKGWKDAPKDAAGNVYLERGSTLKCTQQIDFTYFQTTVNIPANMTINEFKVSYDKADDGARIYFFNSKFPKGTFDPKADLIISQTRDNAASINLKDKIAPGENRVVIVQFDDCADKNSVHNIKISVNGKEVKPVVANTAVAGVATSAGNIAKGKTCRASSVNFGGEASRACDGNASGIYTANSCTHSKDEKDPWWEIDLGAVYDVSSIKIWNRTDDCCWNRLQGFYVMASEQSISSCSTAASFQYRGTSSYSFTSAGQSSMVLDGNKRCRYIRIWIPGDIKILSLAEVEVFGKIATATTTTTTVSSTTTTTSVVATSAGNIAKGKSCRASSVNFGGEASRACDGNASGIYTANSCTHSKDEKDPWWEIDLGAVYDVSSIKIWNRTDDCCWNRLQGFYVMASEQSISSCSTAASFQYKGTSSYSFTSAGQSSMVLDGNKRCRYIRIWIPGDIKILSLAEVEVFGKLATAGSTSAPVTATALPDKFKIHAYSISEGLGDKDDYWVALNNGNTKGVILSKAKLVSGAKWMEIESVSLGNDVYAFKVLNAGADMYITARDNKDVYVDKAVGGKIPDAAKFKSSNPLTAAKGANEKNYRSFESVKFPKQYLRHEGFVMYVHPNNNTELFKQDASWLIQKM